MIGNCCSIAGSKKLLGVSGVSERKCMIVDRVLGVRGADNDDLESRPAVPAIGGQTRVGTSTSTEISSLGPSTPAPNAGSDPLALGRFGADIQLASAATAAPAAVDRRGFPATIATGKAGGSNGRGGAETNTVLPISGLKPVQNADAPQVQEIVGPQMLIVDNPETFRSPGVLASTMAPVQGRGDTSHDFVGVARYFALSQNATGKALRNMILVKNTSSSDVEFRIQGEVYCNKGVTKTDGRIQSNYKADGEFQGPHAIASSAYLDAQAGKNGYVAKSITIKAGDTEVVNDQYHETGSEVFALVEITANNPRATFRVAGVANETSLDEGQENKVGRGEWASAGDASKEDFAGADKNRLGRPNGVITAGSVFSGGRTFEVTAGSKDGDLVMATRLKNAGESDAVAIDKPLPNKDEARNGKAASIDEGNYGIEYLLKYGLKNSTAKPVTAKLLFTAPRSSPKEEHKPMGGEIVMPMEIDGKRVEVRINARGGGVQVGSWTVAPGTTKVVPVRFVNFGNIFPPAGFEVRGE
jgi:hypothetical protein